MVNGEYVVVQEDENGSIRSSSLGLDFRIRNGEIGIYDPVANDWVRTRVDAETIRADDAEIRAETAETRATQAEAKVAELREQIARLQART